MNEGLLEDTLSVYPKPLEKVNSQSNDGFHVDLPLLPRERVSRPGSCCRCRQRRGAARFVSERFKKNEAMNGLTVRFRLHERVSWL